MDTITIFHSEETLGHAGYDALSILSVFFCFCFLICNGYIFCRSVLVQEHFDGLVVGSYVGFIGVHVNKALSLN